MPTNEDYQAAFEASCRSYWTTRDSQAITGGGEGLAAAVRAGKHFGSLEDLVESVFVDCGYSSHNFLRSVSRRSRVTTGARKPGTSSFGTVGRSSRRWS